MGYCGNRSITGYTQDTIRTRYLTGALGILVDQAAEPIPELCQNPVIAATWRFALVTLPSGIR
jgi:hypothetical protein